MTVLNLGSASGCGIPRRHASPPDAPGLLFYREMFGSTGRSGASTRPHRILRDIHLSDGGHFENLALYELVRRHCRYIIVSDCGADPEVAFDDLGNALRRIREDFGVDIDVDVSPLRPDAAGSLAAARRGRHDPLLADRPRHPALRQADNDRRRADRRPAIQDAERDFRTRRPPTSSTTRRSGNRIAGWASTPPNASSTSSRADDGDSEKRDADWLFAGGEPRCRPKPGLQGRSLLEMTKRFGVLEAELHELRGAKDRPGLSQSPSCAICPRRAAGDVSTAGSISLRPPSNACPNTRGQQADRPTEEFTSLSDVPFLMRVIQLMEDAWLTRQL